MHIADNYQVLRYAALGTGVFYGLYHQRRLTSKAKNEHAQSEYQRKEALIMQAKAEWAQKSAKQQKPTSSSDAISDPNDSRFDLEAYLTKLAADDQKSHI
ncbi:ATP synthase E chain-domain-containing protein [Geopyxis carbonaria]|nr:ATP synthase E chain-domain-containing protein [Geopyxis carbonaria]